MTGFDIDRPLDDIIEERNNGRGGKVRTPTGVSGFSSKARTHPYGRPDHRQSERQPAGGKARGLIGEELDANVEFPSVTIKVGSQQDAREVAERVCMALRTGNGEAPALLTIGSSSVNQAVKAIAIARAELEQQGIELTFQPAFRHSDRTKPLIAFYLSNERRSNGSRYSPGLGDEVQLTVTSTGKISPVAGAIAGKTRQGQKVCLAAIGVDAVSNAVLAVGNARLFLEQDGMDIKVIPTFDKVPKNGQTMTAINLHIIAERL